MRNTKKKKEEVDISAKSVQTGKAISWLTAIDGLKQEIVNLGDEASKLQSDIDAFKPFCLCCGPCKTTSRDLYADILSKDMQFSSNSIGRNLKWTKTSEDATKTQEKVSRSIKVGTEYR